MTSVPVISLYLNQIVPMIQIGFGTFGNLMNILIFTRRSLQRNPCSNYFVALSINNLFVLYVALLTRSLASGWNIDPTPSNNILCKLRLFFVYVSLCLIQWLLVLASIDRYLSICQDIYYRQLSNKSTARKSILALVILIMVAHFHVLVWWSSRSIGSMYICNKSDQTYDYFFSIFNILFTSLLPPCLMITFGLKTILNVKRIRSRVALETNNPRNERFRSKDRQLIVTLLFQVLVVLICTTPLTITYLYSTLKDNFESSAWSRSDFYYYYLIVDIARLLNYCNPVSGFYICTLTSRTFRHELKTIFKRVLTKLCL